MLLFFSIYWIGIPLKYVYANLEICNPKGSGGGETGVTETAFLSE